MSPPPRRWLDDAGAPDGARDLLRRAAKAPDPTVRHRVWESLQSSTAPAAATTAAAATKAAAGASSLAVVGTKGSVVAALALLGSMAVHRAQTPSDAADFVARPAAPPPLARAVAPANPPVTRPIAAVTPPPALPPEPSLPTAAPVIAPFVVRLHPIVAPRVARARPHAVEAPAVIEAPVAPAAPFTDGDEFSALNDARRVLATNPAAALNALSSLDARLGGAGALSHERARYTIDALYRLGRDGEAIARADAFLRESPRSTVSAAIRSLRQSALDRTNQ